MADALVITLNLHRTSMASIPKLKDGFGRFAEWRDREWQ